MPCGCFGSGKKAKGKVKVPPSPLLDKNSPTIQVKGQDDPNKTAKRRDVVASYYGDECALLGYKPTGSRPPSSCVDSPNSHTPSTAPIDACSRDLSVSSSSPIARRSSRLQGAICRSQLAEKRREFFRDFSTSDYRSSPYALSSTLPARTRPNFGKPLRTSVARPVSQPCEDEHPLLPPGPHLLHPSPSDERAPKIDPETLASHEFLFELKSASQEISKRWAMSEDELQDYPATLKMKTRKQLPLQNNYDEEDPLIINDEFIIGNSHHVYAEHMESTTMVPETVITPPSPQVVDFSVPISQEPIIQYDDTLADEVKEAPSNNNILLSLVKQPNESDTYSNSSSSSSSCSERVLCTNESQRVEVDNISEAIIQVSQIIENEESLKTVNSQGEAIMNLLEEVEERNSDVAVSYDLESPAINLLNEVIEPEIDNEEQHSKFSLEEDSTEFEIITQVHSGNESLLTPLVDVTDLEFGSEIMDNEESVICPLEEEPTETEFMRKSLPNQNEQMVLEEMEEPEFVTQTQATEYESMISPLEDDDYPLNYELDEQSQAEMMKLLERENAMDNVGIVENDDEEIFEESTIIVNPFVQESDLEEIITPHDSRLQLIAEEDVEEDVDQPSSLSSEDGELITPFVSDTPMQSYEHEINVKNEQYNIENEQLLRETNESFFLESNEGETLQVSEHVNINLIESSSTIQQQFVEGHEEDKSSKQKECITQSCVAPDRSKVDSIEVTHDDGLGSEIDEGSDLIEEQAARNVRHNASSDRPT